MTISEDMVERHARAMCERIVLINLNMDGRDATEELVKRYVDASFDGYMEQSREYFTAALHGSVVVPAKTAQAMGKFIMMCLMEGPWQGADVDGGAAQDKAQALGLIVETTYDPEKHGASDSAEPGDSWFVPSADLLATITRHDGDTATSWADCIHDWAEVDFDLGGNRTAVKCKKCQCPGERDDNNLEIFWPAT